MAVLKVWTNKIDWYVAQDARQLRKLRAARDSHGRDEEWYALPDDEDLVIYEDEERTESTTKRASEWATRNGVGFLASTEY